MAVSSFQGFLGTAGAVAASFHLAQKYSMLMQMGNARNSSPPQKDAHEKMQAATTTAFCCKPSASLLISKTANLFLSVSRHLVPCRRRVSRVGASWPVVDVQQFLAAALETDTLQRLSTCCPSRSTRH